MNECHDNIPSVYNQIHTSGTKSWKKNVIPSTPISCQSIIATCKEYKTKSNNSRKYYTFPRACCWQLLGFPYINPKIHNFWRTWINYFDAGYIRSLYSYKILVNNLCFIMTSYRRSFNYIFFGIFPTLFTSFAIQVSSMARFFFHCKKSKFSSL